MSDRERTRLTEDDERIRQWRKWGPYLADRQWGTVREDYSADGEAWAYFPFDHAHVRAYRWGEDGLLGVCDRQGRLNFGLAVWNGQDPILKERLFGLSGPEGNHGEDVKELYYYLDSSPSHSFMRALYRYPQRAFPYAALRAENRRRRRTDPEFELLDTGIFDDNRYFDIEVRYAKATPDDLLIEIDVRNAGPDAAPVHLLPHLWFRNTWAWGRKGEGYWPKPHLWAEGPRVLTSGMGLAGYELACEEPGELLFTDNESNSQALWGVAGAPYTKDAFHRRVVSGDNGAVNPNKEGTKAAVWLQATLAPGETRTWRLRLHSHSEGPHDAEGASVDIAFGAEFARVFAARQAEYETWLHGQIPSGATSAERLIARQASAGLLWSKQFYHYSVKHWIEGDPAHPAPPASRASGRNAGWHQHLYNRDILSMPDKWEYPWYAAWDLAFHMLPFARIDPGFATGQMELLLREWYMHPSGQLPAYEWNFSDVNPPVHAWAAWRVYKLSAPRGARDRRYLEHIFQKLLLNFTWWVNRKDEDGRNLFAGGFLGLDNIGVFDRSKPLPAGARILQADGTAWMAFFSTTMLAIALELAENDRAYDELASKFFEHFVHIADAMNHRGQNGLWHDEDGFYYDEIHAREGGEVPLRVRSMVGIIPLFAAEVVDDARIARLPGFAKRMRWFMENRPDLARSVTVIETPNGVRRLLAIPSRERLERVLKRVLDEAEFLSPHGVRSLSRVHLDAPFRVTMGGEVHEVRYTPGDSDIGMFGGNSNWRGPVWFPVNVLLIEALERYHYFYGDDFTIECPTGSGVYMTLGAVAQDLAGRLVGLFAPDKDGRRPCHGDDARYADDPAWRDLILFYEYFHGDDGRGVGASHQTGWSALVLECLRTLRG